MRERMHTTRRRLACFLGSGVLLAGTASLMAAGPAEAGPCGAPVLAGTTCTMTGTLTLSSGPLTLTSPTALAWTGTLSGIDQFLVDPNAAHQTYAVDDATGLNAGWSVTTSATTFTTTSALTLPVTAFSTNGSITSITDTTAPSATCLTGATCTLPTDTTTYPVAITTTTAGLTAVTIYHASATTGLGSIVIGLPGADPVGWWLNVPANTQAGTYTSTITMEIIAGPLSGTSSLATPSIAPPWLAPLRAPASPAGRGTFFCRSPAPS
jgi:WxL domain surface cell wall-binding